MSFDDDQYDAEFAEAFGPLDDQEILRTGRPGQGHRHTQLMKARAESGENLGYVELPGGWCVPPDQAPELRDQNLISAELNFVRAHPFTVQRGGITYPKPKGTTVTRNRIPLQKQLRSAEELRAALDLHIEDMKKLVRDTIPPEPATASRFAVDVYFTPRGKRYEFLLLRTDDGRWWTTGTSEATKMFRNWKALYEWLTGPDVDRVSDLHVLEYRGGDYKLDLGETVQSPQVSF